MANIHIITNPLSGHNRKHPTRFDAMLVKATQKCHPNNSITVHKPRGLDVLLETVQQIYREQGDILCIHGGDGTVHQAFTALWQVYGTHTPYPQIAILKGGTMNNIARNVGVGFWSTASQLLEAITSQQNLSTCIRHPLVVNDTRSGFIYGNVALAPFLQDYYTGSPPSPAKGFWMFCKTVFSAIFNTAYAQRILAPTPFQMVIDDQPLPKDAYTMLGLSTVADLGFYFRPFYNTLQDPTSLQVIAMTCSPLNIVKVLPHLWFAKPTRKPYITDKIGKKVHFLYDTPQVSTMDGDVYPPQNEETICVGPAVTFLHL